MDWARDMEGWREADSADADGVVCFFGAVEVVAGVSTSILDSVMVVFVVSESEERREQKLRSAEFAPRQFQSNDFQKGTYHGCTTMIFVCLLFSWTKPSLETTQSHLSI
jgi:hypothetical protein